MQKIRVIQPRQRHAATPLQLLTPRSQQREGGIFRSFADQLYSLFEAGRGITECN